MPKKRSITLALLCLVPSGCASMWETSDAWGITQPHVQVIAERSIDTNGDGIVDATEITEKVRRQLAPEVVATGQQLARQSTPGPWGEIAAAAVGALSLIVGGVSVTTRKRIRKIESQQGEA